MTLEGSPVRLIAAPWSPAAADRSWHTSGGASAPRPEQLPGKQDFFTNSTTPPDSLEIGPINTVDLSAFVPPFSVQ